MRYALALLAVAAIFSGCASYGVRCGNHISSNRTAWYDISRFRGPTEKDMKRLRKFREDVCAGW